MYIAKTLRLIVLTLRPSPKEYGAFEVFSITGMEVLSGPWLSRAPPRQEDIPLVLHTCGTVRRNIVVP